MRRAQKGGNLLFPPQILPWDKARPPLELQLYLNLYLL